MKRKQKFLRAVEILAPGDQFTLNMANLVPEKKLPAFPGGAALEFVVALQRRGGSCRELVEASNHSPVVKDHGRSDSDEASFQE